MEKENKRVYITKRLIREALLQLLQTQHVDQISVKELCEEAYVNRSTFYRYYTLPKDILTEMEVEIFKQFQITKPFSGQEALKAYLKHGFQYLYENSAVMKLLIQNTTPDDYTSLLTPFAQQLLELNGVKDVPPQKLRLLLASLGGGSFYLIRQWINDEEPLTPDELVEFAMEMVDRSISIIF